MAHEKQDQTADDLLPKLSKPALRALNARGESFADPD
jgi:hypothetical protein